jgi:aminoglycoside 6-adenylyltransferase
MNVMQFYAKLKSELVTWSEMRDEVRAVMVVGSQARVVKSANEHSDLDILLFVSEVGESGEEYLDWMKRRRPIWMVVEDHREESRNWLILYQGGIKVDLAVTPVSEMEALITDGVLWDEMVRGYELLVDKDGFGARMPEANLHQPPIYIPPSEDEFIRRVENYFYGAVYVAKQICKENLWKAKWADIYQQTFLLEMLEWHAHAVSDEPVDTWFRGDFMRDWVDERTWEELNGVFGRFDAADSRRALLASIELFTKLAEETADKLDYRLPVEMINEVRENIEGIITDR